MSNNSSSASRVAAHNLKGVPYTGWIEGVGYQHLRNRPIVNCYFRDGGVSLPNFEPVIDTSPKMRVASVGGKYRVEQGENLSIIARRFGTTPDAIMAANSSIDWAVARKKGALIYPGELLEIPPVFEEASAQNRPVPRAQVVDLKSFYGEKGRGGLNVSTTPTDNTRIEPSYLGLGGNPNMERLDRGYYYNPGEIRSYEPDLMDKWSRSSNFFCAATYSIANDLYLFAQASPFGAVFIPRNERAHLNGVLATQGEVEFGFFGGLSTFMPSPLKGQNYFKNMPKSMMYPNDLVGALNSSQFGTKFRGTFLTKGEMRYTYNRYYNKGASAINNWYNKSGAKAFGTTIFSFFNED